MPNRNYLRGRRKEYAVMRTLEEVGYHCYRTAGSHGHFDVIAWHPKGEYVRFIQVKTGAKASAKDREALNALQMPDYGHIELWEFRKRGQPATVTHIK